MADRCVILVDAGYLLATGGTRVAGTSLRSAIRVDYEKLISGIFDLSQRDSGLDALRLYWYDASRDGIPTELQKQIALTAGVKIRLGRISFNGEQKGVDLKIGLDLVNAARNRSASVAYLVSGDDDLAEAVEAAQELGMRVVLVGIENVDHHLGVLSVAEDIALRADAVLPLPGLLVDDTFARAVQHPPVAAAAPVPASGPRPGPRPKPIAPLPITASASTSASQLVYSTGEGSTSTETVIDIAREVGVAVAESWYGSTTQMDLNGVMADRPVLPVEIDRVLLRDCARRIGEAETDLQTVRRALRAAFWEYIDRLN